MAVAMAVVSCKKDDKVVGKDKDGKELIVNEKVLQNLMQWELKLLFPRKLKSIIGAIAKRKLKNL